MLTAPTSVDPGETPIRLWQRPWVVLPTLALLLYGRSLGYPFLHWDDMAVIRGNPLLSEPTASALVELLHPRAWGGMPLRTLTWVLNYQISGWSTWSWHLGNVLLHSTAGCLLFACLDRLFRQLGHEPRRAALGAWLAALLFIVHPINVEAVTWLVARKYPLMATFLFAAWLCYLRAVEAGSATTAVRRYLAAGGLYLLAMLSLPTAITFPAVFVLTDCCRRSSEPAWRVIVAGLPRYVGYLLLGLLFYWLAYKAFAGDGGAGIAFQRHPFDQPLLTLSTGLRVLSDYITLLLWPAHLNNRYVDYVSYSLLQPAVMIGFLLAVSIVWLFGRGLLVGPRLAALCIGWWLCNWFPVSGVVPLPIKMADRYMYVPGIGLFVALAWALSAPRLPSRVAALRTALIAAVLVALGAMTIVRNGAWKSDLALWTDSLQKDPEGAVARKNLAKTYLEAGDLDRYIEHLERLAEIRPSYPDVYRDLAIGYRRRGEWAASLRATERAIATGDINDPALHANAGIVLTRLGRPDQAAAAYRRALQIDPKYHTASFNLANLERDRGNPALAETLYEQIIAAAPEHHAARFNLANLQRDRGDLAVAIASYREALRQPSKYTAGLLFALADTLRRQGNATAAVAELQRLLTLTPGAPPVHRALAQCYRDLGDEAAATAHESLARDGEDSAPPPAP